MNQLLKNFIPLGDTGNICYLQDHLKDFDSNDSNLIQKHLTEFKTKKIKKLILLRSQTKQINYESISKLLHSEGFQFGIYTPNSELKEQVELFETILDSNKQENVCILFFGRSPALYELTSKLLLYKNINTPIEEIYYYLTDETPDAIILNELNSFVTFLENDPYLITKPDRSEFKKNLPLTTQAVNGAKSSVSTEELKTDTGFNLNLNSLKIETQDNESLLTGANTIPFNLSSLIETDFEKEESPEEHYEKLKESSRQEKDESLSLDVDLSQEIEYISSLESLSGPTMDKISVININTVPFEAPNPVKTPTPTIDYKNKNYIDFEAMIEDEIDQGMLIDDLSEHSKPESSISFPDALEFDDLIAEEKEDAFSFEDVVPNEDTIINLDAMETKVNIDLSFPLPMQDLEDLLEREIENEKEEGFEHPVDPSQTFMARRISDMIKKEVLSEDSKGKIPVSDFVKIDTKNTEVIPQNTNPTHPKITSPKFNPITLDD